MIELFKNNDYTKRKVHIEAYESTVKVSRSRDRDFETFVQTRIAPNVECVSECPRYIVFSFINYILKRSLESIVHCVQKLVFKCLAAYQIPYFSMYRVKLICKNSVECM